MTGAGHERLLCASSGEHPLRLSLFRPHPAQRPHSAVSAARARGRLLHTYRQIYPVSREVLRGAAEQFQGWVKEQADGWNAPIVTIATLVLSWVMFHLLSFIAGHPLWMTRRCDRSGISPRGKGSKPGPAQPPRRADSPHSGEVPPARRPRSWNEGGILADGAAAFTQAAQRLLGSSLRGAGASYRNVRELRVRSLTPICF